MKAQLPDASMKLRQQNQTKSTSRMLNPLFHINFIGQALSFISLFGYAVSDIWWTATPHKLRGYWSVLGLPGK